MKERKVRKDQRKSSEITTSNKMAINTYLSIITLDENELNDLIKRCRVVEGIKKKKNRGA